MFRPMRRAWQQLSRAEAAAILERGSSGVLAVLGDDGYPYAVPLNYVWSDGKIFFHCAKAGHKLDAIRSGGKVSFCVVDRDDVIPEKQATYYRSAVAFGRARILEAEEEILLAARLFGRKYVPDPEAVEREIRREWNGLCCVEITVEHLTGKEAGDLARARGKSPQNHL